MWLRINKVRLRSRQEIVEALPELLGAIQGQLLDLVSLVLARRPHRDSLSQPHINALHAALQHGALWGPGTRLTWVLAEQPAGPAFVMWRAVYEFQSSARQWTLPACVIS